MTEFDRLREVVARLRAEDGCPWDRKQTHNSLKPECVEEAAEVVCGINILEETGNADNLKEELGDLLLQVVMHAQIAEEEGIFTMDDVCRGISRKMIRRHPHVFGEETVRDSREVVTRWEDIKKQEKAGKEWMETYLPGAFEEAKELIGAAEKRKGIRKPVDELIGKTTEYFRGDGKRIQHFMKVYAYSAMIGRQERIDAQTQSILEAAAVVHDVGIKPAEMKYGYNNGKLQEELGPAEAEILLTEAGYTDAQIRRITYLVGHHHTYTSIDGIDYQILVEADFLVNLQEEHSPEKAIRGAYEKIFQTESGKKLCRDIFGLSSAPA